MVRNYTERAVNAVRLVWLCGGGGLGAGIADAACVCRGICEAHRLRRAMYHNTSGFIFCFSYAQVKYEQNSNGAIIIIICASCLLVFPHFGFVFSFVILLSRN